MEYAFALGSNPSLSIAELTTVLPKLKRMQLLDDNILFAKLPEEIKDPQAHLDSLGGTIAIYKLPYYTPECTTTAIRSYMDEHFDYESKIHFAITFVDLKDKFKRKAGELAMKVKKKFREDNISARAIQGPITAAHMIKERLFPPKGLHIIVIQKNNTFYMGHAIAVQNIDNYSKRDYEKPARDAKNGMLPPKLSQIMLNLAQPKYNQYVYDPFMGVGTVLIEAIRNGFDVQGSDLQERFVPMAQQNIEWFITEFPEVVNANQQLSLFQADATKLSVEQLKNVGAVVTEGFLGRPQLAEPSPQIADHILKEVSDIHMKFFSSLENLESGVRVCVTMPVIKTTAGPKQIDQDVIRNIVDLGFTRINPLGDLPIERFNPKSLIYGRDDQIVHRQIIVFEKD